MVVLVGEVGEGLLAELDRSGNVSVVRAPEVGQRDGAQPPPAWQPGALAMREAARRQSAYVIVPDDPLAGVAARGGDGRRGVGRGRGIGVHGAGLLSRERRRRGFTVFRVFDTMG